MFELREYIKHEQISNFENLDNYISHFKVCSLLGIGRANKVSIGNFIQSYTKDTQIFYKKSDVDLLLVWNSQLAPIKNLSSILKLNDNKCIKAFLERYSIRVIYDGRHPFGHSHLYYLEDLDMIKEKRKEDIIKNLENVKNLHKNTKYHKKKINNSMDDSIYYSHQTACKILGTAYPNDILKKLVSCYYNGEFVFHKIEDINRFLNLKNEIAPIKDLSTILQLKSTEAIINNLLKMRFKILHHNEHPFGRMNFYYKKDHDAIVKNYFKEAPDDMTDMKKYISYKESLTLLDYNIPLAVLAKLTAKYKIKGIVYFLRKDIELFSYYKGNTITIPELMKKLDYIIDHKSLGILLKKEKINVIKADKHPFGGANLVFKTDISKIRDIIEFTNKVKNESNRYEKYKLLISKVPNTKQTILKTLNDFNDIFIFERFENCKSEGLPLILSQTYEIIVSTLTKNFLEYSVEDTNRIVSIVYNNERYSQKAKIEFINFYNHLITKYNVKNRLPYNINKKDMVIHGRNADGYTQSQLLSLFSLLYKSLDDKSYLNKAIESKTCAMVWLYMYLHYVTLWRCNSIINISKPNLKIIGFENGESFIEWLKDPSNTFTIEMGIKICDSVKRQIDSLNIKASKNNQPLVFEVGRLMARGAGLLLALCEAHRQIYKKNIVKNYKKRNLDTIITTWVLDFKGYYQLFGDKYTEIMGTLPFSNLKANKAFNNYTLNYSEKNGDGLGGHILSIMRGHVVNIQGISNTTPMYETRHVDKTIEDIEATLFERGTFGFTKFMFLSLCDKNFIKMDSTAQTNLIKGLPLTPLESELVMKGIFKQREIVVRLITKMTLSEPDQIKELFRELAFGKTVAKHNHTRCLLKAILNCNISDINKRNSLEVLEDYKDYSTCLMPEFDYCCGCPMLIGEIYFLYELNELINVSIQSLKSCKSQYERHMHSNIILNAYMPILYEAQEVLGNDIIDTFIDIKSIVNNLNLLSNENKILLELERNNNDCS